MGQALVAKSALVQRITRNPHEVLTNVKPLLDPVGSRLSNVHLTFVRSVRPRLAGLERKVDLERLDLLDSYRLLSGVSVDLRTASMPARLYLLDLSLRLAQGQGYAELLARLMRPDIPLYDGMSPLAPGAQELPAVRAARDLVYRAGVAEGTIEPGPAEAAHAPLPGGLRAAGAGAATGEGAGLTTEAIVTVGEAMEMLGITRQAVINAVRTGRVRGEQHGKLWVLSRDDVLRYRMARDDRKMARGMAD